VTVAVSLQALRARVYIGLYPWLIAVVTLAAVWVGVHYGKLAPAQEQLAVVEGEWAGARRDLAQRLEARQARQDLQRVMAMLPSSRDFARLPLAISEMASRDGVSVPALSYTLEKSSDGLATKAFLQGAVTGSYQDLRRFIYHLEAADGLLLFIEDLSAGRSSGARAEKTGKGVTVTLRLATYIREESPAGRALRAGLE
jgi:hypothetical protein